MMKTKKVSALIMAGILAITAMSGCTGKEEAAADDYAITVGYYNCDHMTAGPVAELAGPAG